jgi:hypothetical protein
MAGVSSPQSPFIADRHNPRHQRQTGIAPERHKRKKTMFKTFTAALIAASMLTAPAFAQGTAPAPSAPATQMTKAPATKVVKTSKHKVKKHAHVRKHVKQVRHARHGRHHVKHVSVKKPAHAAQTVGSAPKAGTN